MARRTNQPESPQEEPESPFNDSARTLAAGALEDFKRMLERRHLLPMLDQHEQLLFLVFCHLSRCAFSHMARKLLEGRDIMPALMDHDKLPPPEPQPPSPV